MSTEPTPPTSATTSTPSGFKRHRTGGARSARAEANDGDVVRREFTVEVDGKRFQVDLEEHDAPAVDVEAAAGGGGGGATQPRPDRAGPADDNGGDADVSADGETVIGDMQGTILSVYVAGDEVAPGDVLVVLEAMKMENDVVAEFGGTMAEVAVAEADSVDMGDPLDRPRVSAKCRRIG